MAGRSRAEWGTAARGGLFAGIMGGLALDIFWLLVAWLNALDAWAPLKSPGAVFLGVRARTPGFDLGALAVGQLTHFAVSAFWGLLFGLLVYGVSKPSTVWMGLLWGLFVCAAMFLVVLPMVGLGGMAQSTPVFNAIVQHLLYGLATAVAFLPFQRSLRHPLGPEVES